MASNHTEHFSLNQWLPDDQVKRTDFNEDNAKLDAALNDLSGGLAEKADQTALDNPTRAPWISQPRWAVPQSLLWSGQKTATTAVSF